MAREQHEADVVVVGAGPTYAEGENLHWESVLACAWIAAGTIAAYSCRVDESELW